MSKTVAKGLVLVVALTGGALSIPNVDAGGAAGVNSRWEYRVLTRQEVLDLGKKDLAAGLNKLGNEGWELVAVDVPQYIFKRSGLRNANQAQTLKEQLALVERDIEMRKDRLAWSERMARKGFLTDGEVQVLKLRLKEAETVRDWAKRELDALLPTLKKAGEKIPVPEK